MGAVLERENPSYHYLALFPGSTLILTLLSGKSLGMRLITTHIGGNLADATACLVAYKVNKKVQCNQKCPNTLAAVE